MYLFFAGRADIDSVAAVALVECRGHFRLETRGTDITARFSLVLAGV